MVRRSLCFSSICNKDKTLKDRSPHQVARKCTAAKNNGNPSTGIWYGKEKTEQYIKGGNKGWRMLKSLLRSHLLGISTSAHAKQHFLACKEHEDDQRCKETALSATKALVKMKAASTHYETFLTLLDNCKVNIEQLNHSRKQMLPMLVAAEDYVDQKTATLKQELPSTLMTLHFYGFIDKATVNRRTSQASYIVFQSNGRRCAYPLGAPLVYAKAKDSSSENSKSDGENSPDEELDRLPDVDGGSAGDLARNLLDTIVIKLKLECKDLSKYCGTTADGQYQAEDFLATIRKETGRENLSEDLTFCQTTIWDASYLLNLASTDIKEGKCGTSQTFFNKLIKRANEFNHLLSRGKGYAQLEVSATEKKRAVVVTPFAAQRFLSSAINQ